MNEISTKSNNGDCCRTPRTRAISERHCTQMRARKNRGVERGRLMGIIRSAQREVRNPKFEIQNKSEIQMWKIQMKARASWLFGFRVCSFEFVLDFELRISDFPSQRPG